MEEIGDLRFRETSRKGEVHDLEEWKRYAEQHYIAEEDVNDWIERHGDQRVMDTSDIKDMEDEIEELKEEIDELKETCMGMCKQLEDATKHEIEDPTKFYRGIVAVEELKEENNELEDILVGIQDELIGEVFSPSFHLLRDEIKKLKTQLISARAWGARRLDDLRDRKTTNAQKLVKIKAHYDRGDLADTWTMDDNFNIILDGERPQLDVIDCVHEEAQVRGEKAGFL